ncbi:MerR family transcriptional regulator [Pseudonocardia zijingensis]|uniref:MerR family transcriptional regulator n=1 Tax=Pseudonocardia zijingensis TaxID=153376 RepID=A0ABN1N913_9PSEU
MLIGELSRRTGVSPRSLRYYEQHGLLRSSRTANGWRDYDETAEHRARTVAEMLAAGLTIEGVKELGPCLDQPDLDACDDPTVALATYRARLAVVEQRMAALQRHRDELARRVEALAAR